MLADRFLLCSRLAEAGKTSDDIASVKIRTQEAAVRLLSYITERRADVSTRRSELSTNLDLSPTLLTEITVSRTCVPFLVRRHTSRRGRSADNVIAVIFGRLTSEDYSDEVAADPRIDALRDKVSLAPLSLRRQC